MSLRTKLKSIVPPSWWMFAGFCKRLPVYWKLDRSDSLRVMRGIEGLPLFVTPDVFVHIPESITPFLNWRLHAIENAPNAAETAEFLELSIGCSNLIDIGSQSGFMSALFAKSRQTSARILSLEPDPQVHSILARARELNSPPGIDWEIRHIAVSDKKGNITIPTTNALYEPENSILEPESPKPVEAESLSSLMSALIWTPDIIKIDVESHEHEILVPAISLLAEIRPALQLEVHWEMLAARDRNPFEFLGPLYDIGYRGIRRSFFGMKEWEQARKREPISRIALKVG